MQFKSITAIIVLLLVVVSMLVAGCTTQTTTQTTTQSTNVTGKVGDKLTVPGTEIKMQVADVKVGQELHGNTTINQYVVGANYWDPQNLLPYNTENLQWWIEGNDGDHYYPLVKDTNESRFYYHYFLVPTNVKATYVKVSVPIGSAYNGTLETYTLAWAL